MFNGKVFKKIIPFLLLCVFFVIFNLTESVNSEEVTQQSINDVITKKQNIENEEIDNQQSVHLWDMKLADVATVVSKNSASTENTPSHTNLVYPRYEISLSKHTLENAVLDEEILISLPVKDHFFKENDAEIQSVEITERAAVITRIKKTSSGNTSIKANFDDEGQGLLATISDKNIYLTVTTAKGNWSAVINNATGTGELISEREIDLRIDPNQSDTVEIDNEYMESEDEGDDVSSSSSSELIDIVEEDDATTQIDVLVVYTETADDLYEGDAIGQIEHLFELTNQIYVDSGLDLQVNIVHSLSVDYDSDDSISFSDALRDITYGTDGFEGIADLREFVGADLVILYRPYIDGGPTGNAWLYSMVDGDSITLRPALMYSQVAIDTNVRSTAHEMGHIMGLSHSRSQDGEGVNYPYGLGYGIDDEFVTVMAYASAFSYAPKILKFSSPLLDCYGSPCGIDHDTDPDNSADAVRALNMTIGTIADLYSSDIDDDGVKNVTDNCVEQYNPLQEDTNSDGEGDICDNDDDGDGVLDTLDAFPYDNTETTDTDGDGKGDNSDAFPLDSSEWLDTDGDGVGDNSDALPNDETETTDTDGDGIGDNSDAFPSDNTETMDTDGDGTGDNSDALPYDATETTDLDGDGIGDNSDTDIDGDGVDNSNDAFPLVSTESKDTDGDGIGDNSDPNTTPIAVNDSFSLMDNEDGLYTLDVLQNDTDYDGDSLVLEWVSSDTGGVTIEGDYVVLETDDIGTFNLNYKVNDGVDSDIASVTVVIDELLSITVPDDVELNATGLFTKVELGTAVAVDANGESLTASLVDDTTYFEPGLYSVDWTAEDEDGNERQVSQQVTIHPLISIENDNETAEGTTHTISVYLNGDAPIYPVTIPYSIGGSSNSDDHDLIDGEVIIESGTEGVIKFTIYEDELVEGTETLIITLDDSLNLGSKSSYTLTISEDNLSPVVNIDIVQGGDLHPIIEKNGGDVTVTASVSDANQSDVLNYTWHNDNVEITNISSEEAQFEFDPTALASGNYQLQLEVSDGEATIITNIYIEVIEQFDESGSEDADGDGIFDYLETISECNVLQENVSEEDRYLAETEAGICLHKGVTVFNDESGSILLAEDELREDPDAANIGGIFDYIIYDLPIIGQSTHIVIPQRVAIPDDAVYRKYTTELGWVDFVSDKNNYLSSTEGAEGYCPPPGDESWTDGLTVGDWCVQLTIEDGGSNDADGLANRVIVDPGGVSTYSINTTTVDSINISDDSSSGSGGGSLGGIVVFILTLLGIKRRYYLLN